MDEREERGDATVFALDVEDAGDLAGCLAHIGSDPRAMGYMGPKRAVLTLYAPSVDFRAAAFVKQELLARGGDAAVAKGVIDGTAERSGVLMTGTRSQLASLVRKMEALGCWGLDGLRRALCDALAGTEARRWALPLPGGRTLELGRDTKIMGILNVTPDSFHAPSRVEDEADLLRRAGEMIEAGADVLDVGAEATGPGASPLDEGEELSRLLPALRALRRAFPRATISADTRKPGVAREAIDAGADIINDVSGGSAEMSRCVARGGAAYVLSHYEPPDRVLLDVGPEGLMGELCRSFSERLRMAEEEGLSRDRVVVDPGIGFGKRGRGDLIILKEIRALRCLGRPILIGCSRKRTIADATGAMDLIHGTVAASALVEGAAQLVRVHDVGPNADALLMARAIREARAW
ncbi:MAG: dihydropteroate synthase [Synergistaceae bacterium]|nr:dihydropteroate synthase [Synergistaceae bacterium]